MQTVRYLILMLCLFNVATVQAMRDRAEMGVKPIQKKPAATKPATGIPAPVTTDQDKSKALKTEEAEPTIDKAPADAHETSHKKPD